jgi:uncharacterized protein YeaO (DUF488 family)
LSGPFEVFGDEYVYERNYGAVDMINVKHFMDSIEPTDGCRIWVEPIGLTRDLTEWCQITHVLCKVAPPPILCDWLDQHPHGYDYFQAQYHEWLNRSQFKPALQRLACEARHENITLLHQSSDPQQNSATALYEFLIELDAYCSRDE